MKDDIVLRESWLVYRLFYNLCFYNFLYRDMVWKIEFFGDLGKKRNVDLGFCSIVEGKIVLKYVSNWFSIFFYFL